MANEFARHLRKNTTDAERFAWARLRGKQLNGFRFRRQVPIGVYVADFVCHEARVVVELDGGQHAERVEHDAARTAFLESVGYRVLRVWNHEVLTDWDTVSEWVCTALTGRAFTPHPNPPPQGGREPIQDSLAGPGLTAPYSNCVPHPRTPPR